MIRSKYGIIFLLGKHPKGRAAMKPWSWTQHESERYRQTGKLPREFFEFPPDSPLVFVNLTFPTFSTGIFQDERWSPYAYATKNKEASLFINDPTQLHCLPFPHLRYLIPSDEYKTKAIKKLVNGSWKKFGPRTLAYVELSSKSLLTVYGMREEQIVAQLRLIFGGSEESIPWGLPGMDKTLRPADFLVRQNRAQELWMLTWECPNAWFMDVR